jgi:alpha-L-arabinofuranosidase
MKKNFYSLGFLVILCMLFISNGLLFSQNETARLILDTRGAKNKINKEVYGHFAEHLGNCIYKGFYVGESSPISNTRGIRNDIIEALRNISIPALRWPGGCFADTYHWKNGIGPKDKRPKILNIFWGQVVEDNSFGTHEFMDLCELLGCEPYISANVGSGSVEEMMEWVEYMTCDKNTPLTMQRKQNGREKPWKLKYIGIGNESWGCGGEMTPEYYSDQYRKYANYCFDYGDNKLFKISSGANSGDCNWTEVLMKNIGERMQGTGMHYYTVEDWNNKPTATNFDKDSWYHVLYYALKMDELIKKQSTIMDKYDPGKRIALLVDEWGTWYNVEKGTNPAFLYQQNSLRDALVAGLTLNIFNNHCERVKMGNLAQSVNVLQSLILTQEDKMVLTPTYYVFKMYKVHQESTLIPGLVMNIPVYKKDKINMPLINYSASVDKLNNINITLCNFDADEKHAISIEILGANIKNIKGEIITAEKIDSYNDFGKKPEVDIKEFNGFKTNKQGIEVNLPSKSVVYLKINQ